MPYKKNIQKTIAFGNNSRNAKELFFFKNFYYDKIYPNGKLPWAERPLDFINNNPLYGKVDLDKNFIYPKPKHLRQINVGKAKTKNLKVFDFVATAFEDFRDHMHAQVNNGHLQAGHAIAACDPKRTFVETEVFYKKFKELHWAYFSLIYLSTPSDHDVVRKFPIKEQIDNFSQFVKYYIEFLKTAAPEIPITLTGALKTSYASPLMTGLCVEIHDKAYDDDRAKQEFIDSPNFNFFKCTARRYGFVLDRNVPWRLVADVTSLKMREYMRIAFEQPQIEEKQAITLQERLDLLQTMTPAVITVDDIVDFNLVNPLADWPRSEVLNFQKETMNQLQEVKTLIMNSNAENWEEVKLKGAADPNMTSIVLPALNPSEEGIQGLVPDCDGTVCSTRVMKFDFFFEEYYNKSHSEDIWELRKILWQFWTSWIENHPYVKKVRTVGCLESGFKTKVVEEKEIQFIEWDDFKSQYGELFWLKFYFDVRTVENKIKWDPIDRKKKMKKINFLNKTLDFYRAVDYINRVTSVEMLDAQEIYVPTPEAEELILDWA